MQKETSANTIREQPNVLLVILVTKSVTYNIYLGYCSSYLVLEQVFNIFRRKITCVKGGHNSNENNDKST